MMNLLPYASVLIFLILISTLSCAQDEVKYKVIGSKYGKLPKYDAFSPGTLIFLESGLDEGKNAEDFRKETLENWDKVMNDIKRTYVKYGQFKDCDITVKNTKDRDCRYSSKVPVTKVIESVTYWYYLAYNDIVPDYEGMRQMLIELGKVESQLGTSESSPAYDTAGCSGWGQFCPPRQGHPVAYNDVVDALKADLDRNGDGTITPREWENSRAKAIRDSWGFNAIDVPKEYRKPGWTERDWKGITTNYFISQDESDPGIIYRRDIALAVFAIEYTNIYDNKVPTTNCSVKTHLWDYVPLYDSDFDSRARWWEVRYNSCDDSKGTAALYEKQNTFEDKNGLDWIYSGTFEDTLYPPFDSYLLLNDESVVGDVRNGNFTVGSKGDGRRGGGCMVITYCDRAYSQPKAEKVLDEFYKNSGYRGQNLAILMASDSEETLEAFSDDSPEIFITSNREEVLDKNCGPIGYIGFFYAGCGSSRVEAIMKKIDEKNSLVNKYFQDTETSYKFEINGLVPDEEGDKFSAAAVTGDLIYGDISSYGLSPEEAEEIMQFATISVPITDSAMDEVISFSSEGQTYSTSFYMVRKQANFTYSGKAYQLSPKLNFSEPANITLLNNGEEFHLGSGMFMYRFNDSGIGDRCNITPLRYNTQVIGKNAAELSMGDITVKVPKNALEDEQELVVQEVKLDCKESLPPTENTPENVSLNLTNNQTTEIKASSVSRPTETSGDVLLYLILIVLVLIVIIMINSRRKC